MKRTTKFLLAVSPQAAAAIDALLRRGLHGHNRTEVVRTLLYRAIEPYCERRLIKLRVHRVRGSG